MNFKKLVFIIIVAILIGFALFYGIKIFSGNKETQLIFPKITKQALPLPTPSPRFAGEAGKPSLPPIDQNSNLKGEIEKLTPTDYSEDFTNLHKETSQF